MILNCVHGCSLSLLFHRVILEEKYFQNSERGRVWYTKGVAIMINHSYFSYSQNGTPAPPLPLMLARICWVLLLLWKMQRGRETNYFWSRNKMSLKILQTIFIIFQTCILEVCILKVCVLLYKIYSFILLQILNL